MPKCNREVHFEELVALLGKDWHRTCSSWASRVHAEFEGKTCSSHPWYSATFGPKGFRRGGAESSTFR
uniref:cysteine-rich protein 1-like n=1 Tax=Jaculus jaculus TaxID=51337 RepID=UPI001E1B5FDB|nr:cysteine-rich protein 1-like [Jaculus jaculus]